MADNTQVSAPEKNITAGIIQAYFWAQAKGSKSNN